MGQEILYCFKCQERITSADLDASKALRFGTRTACKKCVPDLLASLTEKERTELVAKVQSGPDLRTTSSRNLPAATPRRPVPAPAVPKRSMSSSVWIVGVVMVVLFVVAAIVLMNSGAAPSRETREAPVPIPPKATESARERAAREALEKARSLPASDLEGQLAAYAQAMRLAEGTSHEREARERHEGILDMRRKAYAREIAAAEDRVRAMVQKEDFGPALATLEALRPLHAGPEWKALVDERVDQTRKTADTVLAGLKDAAAQARSKGAEDEVKALRQRVGRWGLADKLADLDAHLAGIAPAVEARPWTPLFDGTSLQFLVGGGEGAWVVQDGMIVHQKDRKPSAQTRRLFTDGELRLRFEYRQLTHLGFSVRQGAGTGLGVTLNRLECSTAGDGEHELVIVFRGKEGSATLDGKPRPVENLGNPFKGPLQFNGYGEHFAVKSIEFREPAITDGLIGHWSFDSVSGGKTPDSSPEKNDAVLVDGPVATEGRIGKALQFDGRRSFVKVEARPSLNMTGPFTVSAWLRPRTIDVKAAGIVERWDPGLAQGYNGFLLRMRGGGRVAFGFWDKGTDVEALTQKPLAAGEWTFVAGVHDGESLRVVVNGVPDRALPTTQFPLPSAGPLFIGIAAGSGAHYFPGEIDDVRIYSRALSADEIARLAQGR